MTKPKTPKLDKEIEKFEKNLFHLVKSLFEQTEDYRRKETKRHIKDFCDAQLPQLAQKRTDTFKEVREKLKKLKKEQNYQLSGLEGVELNDQKIYCEGIDDCIKILQDILKHIK